MERLDKYLCDCGIGTRSQVKAILKSGRITVNGKAEKDGSLKINPANSEITFDGEKLTAQGTLVVMLNKPAGFVTATKDPVERTVMELLPPEYQKLDLKPVGRLDKQTEGLLLFTNDGELLHRLISPKKEVPKLYYARHAGTAGPEDIKAFAEGLELKDGTLCLPAILETIGCGESLITVCEGKYHQVRRMMAAREMPVEYLERRKEGNLSLGSLPRGQVRPLTQEELQQLMQIIYA